MHFGCVELVEQHDSTHSSWRAQHVERVVSYGWFLRLIEYAEFLVSGSKQLIQCWLFCILLKNGESPSYNNQHLNCSNPFRNAHFAHRAACWKPAALFIAWNRPTRYNIVVVLSRRAAVQFQSVHRAWNNVIMSSEFLRTTHEALRFICLTSAAQALF